MALFIVRPSRGSWAFFGLVALSALAARGYARHERTLDRRDGPLAETAIQLGRCVLGDIEMITAERAAPNAQEIWAHRAADRLRMLVSRPQDPGWPARCSPLAEHLAMRLSVQSNREERTAEIARSVGAQLQSAGHDRAALVALADADAFAEQLAALFTQVRTLSDRATEHWDRLPVAPASTDLVRPAMLEIERLHPAPGDWERLQLVDAEGVYFYASGTVVRANFDNRSFAGVALAVPVLDGRHGEALHFEDDDGPMLSLVRRDIGLRNAAFPEALAHGREGFEAWEVASSSTTVALLSQHLGTVALRTAPHDGPLVWTRPATIGPLESALAAVVAAEPEGDGERYRVSVLRPRVDDAWLEQYVVTLTPSLPAAPLPIAPQPAHTHAHTRAPAEVTATSSTERSVGVDALASMTLDVSAPTRVLTGIPMFGGRVLTCASGAVRYLALHADRNTSELVVLRIDGAEVARVETSANIPRDRPWVFTCDRDRALIETDPSVPRRGAFLAEFSRFESGSLTLLEPPLVGPSARIESLSLMRDAVVAVASGRTTLRTWRLAHGERDWTPEGLVTLLEQTGKPARSVRHIDAVSSEHGLALRIEGMETPIPPPPPPGTDENHPAPPPPPAFPFVALAHSGDDAVHFSFR